MNPWQRLIQGISLAVVVGLTGLPVSAQIIPGLPTPGVPTPALPAPALPSPIPATEPDAVVRSLIPSVISLRRPSENTLSFGLTALNYPPVQFPARYLSNAQEFAVFSSSVRPWTVQLEVIPRPDARGNLLDVSKLSYRLGGGLWLPVLPTSQVIVSGAAPTLGWNPLTLEFALDLSGAEVSGDASFDLRFTANLLP